MTSFLAIQSVNPAVPVLAQINPVVINLLVGAFLLISIVMVLIVLIQRPQGGGLGGAFGAGGGGGGGGAGQTAFGTKTGDVLTGGTIAIFVLFIIFAIILNFVTRPQEAPSAQPVLTAPASETTPADDDLTAEDVEEAVEEALDEASDLTNEMINDGIEAADDLIDDAQDAVEPITNPTADPVADPAEDE
ncbi:MAG: preprotein translocase subunit SecG [Phycisphaerales bacterium]|nr:preprotein translocase subunit SecG [Phycisphaerales bacterium]